jgi:hypothetical protein
VLLGKGMNGHSIEIYDRPGMKGWNRKDFLVDLGTHICKWFWASSLVWCVLAD